MRRYYKTKVKEPKPKPFRLRPKHEAYSILYAMLSSEFRLVMERPDSSELPFHNVDLDTAYGRKTAEAYLSALEKAAKPIAQFLIDQGDDLGSSFPFDTAADRKIKAA